MTHNEPRAHWVKEGAIGLGIGVIYGVTVVGVAHPFDTIKTYMQAQPGFENTSMYKTAKSIFKTDGIVGLYRGCVPPLWGSGLYRSIQFSVFEACYTILDNKFGQYEIPGTHGTQIRVVLGGMASGMVRSIVETPLEYAKIRRQMHHNWHLRDTYTGFQITCARAAILMSSYFIIFDATRRHFKDGFQMPFIGPFLASGCSSVLAWWVCWPLEYIKCQIQAGYMNEKNMSVYQRFKYVIKERGGFLALYRGIAPGSLRSFVGNGTAMVVMQYLQKKVSQWGLRD